FTANAEFIHTWLLVDGNWQLYRVLSYNHQQPKKYPPAFEDGYPFPLFDQDSAIDALLKSKHIASLSIGFIEEGQLQQIRAYGQQKTNDPIRHNSIYKVASLTKPVTALTVLQ